MSEKKKANVPRMSGAQLLKSKPGFVKGDLPEPVPGDLLYESFQADKIETKRRQLVFAEEYKYARLHDAWEQKKAGINPGIPEFPPMHAIDSMQEYGEMLAEWASYIDAPVDGCYPDEQPQERPQGQPHPYIAYLRRLFKPGDRTCVMLIHSTREWAPGKSETITGFQSLEEVTKPDTLPTMHALQKEGWHIYVCMNPLVDGAQNRKKDRVAAVRSVYVEADGNGVAVREEISKAVAAGEIPAPHTVVESSPGKFQFVWFVDGFTTTAQQEQMNSSLQVRFNTDASAIDCVRVLRLPGFLNLKPKYAPNFPISQIVEENDAPRYHPEDFKIKIVNPAQKEMDRPAIASEEINKILDFVTEAMDAAGVAYGKIKDLPSGALQIHLIECPWGDGHSENKRGDADVFVNSDGSLGFYCFHASCALRDWAAFRQELEFHAGYKLQFGEPGAKALVGDTVTAEEYKEMLKGLMVDPNTTSNPEATSATEAVVIEANGEAAIVDGGVKTETHSEPKPIHLAESVPNPVVLPADFVPPVPATLLTGTQSDLTLEASSGHITEIDKPTFDLSIEEKVPAYDEKLVRGFYGEAVDLVAGGTSMPVQFPHIIAKTICGLRWAVEGARFEDCDSEPRFYSLIIGEKGTSKGWSAKRCRQLFTNFGREDVQDQKVQRIKIWDGADSGAGLKECFFDEPADAGICLYVDETFELGAKARADRNPEIISTMLSLADSTNVSRGKAGEEGRKRKNDARLSTILCVQPEIIPVVFSGIKAGALGFFDRLTLEFADPRKPGRTPLMEDQREKVEKFYSRFLLLKKVNIQQGHKAQAYIEDYWQSLPENEQAAVRRKKNLYLDHFLIQAGLMAGCEKPKTAGETHLQDALDAIANDQRQAIIRRLHVTTEVSDNIGFYISKFKKIWEKQGAAIQGGADPVSVALTQREYFKRTNAHRNNEEHIAERAWKPFGQMYLMSITKTQSAGPKATWYVPKPESQ